MSWTTPRSWASGEVLTAANMNTHVRDNLAFLFVGTTGQNFPAFAASNASTQSFTQDVYSKLGYDTITTDNMVGWSSASKHYVAPINGVYAIGVSVGREGTGSNVQRAKIVTSNGFDLLFAEFQPSAVSSENAFFSGAHFLYVPAGGTISAQYSISASGTVTVFSTFSIILVH